MNKKIIFSVFAVIFACVYLFSGCKSQPAPVAPIVEKTLDDAIIEAARQIEAVLAAQTAVAILNINTSSDSIANYIVDELTGAFVNSRKFVVTERRRLDTIRSEMNFQLSGDVSDASFQTIGNMVGAAYIITGTFINIGGNYRLRIQAVNVSSAAIETQYSATVKSDDMIAFFIQQDRDAENNIAQDSSFPAAREPTQRRGSTYRVGDWGPAGGIVFYDKGNNSDGWRYLEAAPKELEMTRYWFPDSSQLAMRSVRRPNYFNELGTTVGTGKANTALIDDFLTNERFLWKDEMDIPSLAAAYCASIDHDGFTDWFLPSIDELVLMEQNLYKNGLGEFEFRPYFSSSITAEFQDNEFVIWVYDFYGNDARRRGVENSTFGARFLVRPIRAF